MPRSENQKLKLLYIAEYLKIETDEDHRAYVKDIKEYLAAMGIEAEAHSISRDIALLRDVYEMDIEGGRGQPYWLCSRDVEYQDLIEMAECIGSAKFISNPEAQRLVGVLKQFCSRFEAEKMSSDVFLVDRSRTTEKSMIRSLGLIRDAIKQRIKIAFQYTYHSIDNLEEVRLRRKGASYIVSPFEIILNDGNYYLLAYDEKRKDVLTYRIDRMKGLKYVEQPIEGEEKFKHINLKEYTRQSFGMFGGTDFDVKRITIRFTNNLLDAVLDRFGSPRGTYYKKVDDSHFRITVSIIVSKQFFGWISGFGTSAVIETPEVAKEYIEFLEEIKTKYSLCEKE